MVIILNQLKNYWNKNQVLHIHHTDKPYDQETGAFKILQNKMVQTNDIGMNLRMGMYANRTIYVDIVNQTKEIVDFKISDFNLKKPPKLLNGIEDFPTRLMLRVNDYGSPHKKDQKRRINNQRVSLPFTKINLILEITIVFTII